MGKKSKKPKESSKKHFFHRRSPPRMLPQSRGAFHKFKQYKWKSPIPYEYKKVAKALNAVQSYNADLTLMINPYKKYTKDLYQLALIAIIHKDEVDYLLKKFHILEKNKFIDPWVAKVLITEMLWGKQLLRSSSNPVEALKYYEEDLRESFVEVMTLFPKTENAIVATPLPTYVRINTLLTSVEEIIQTFENKGWNLLPRSNTYSEHLKILAGLGGHFFMRDFHVSELLIFPPGTSFYNHPGLLKGLFLLQDKGSCLSSFLLNPDDKSTVLDICAAPGIKTNHLANIMENKGTIYANDIHPDRSAFMRNLMQLTGVRNVKQMANDYLTVNPQDVTHILIDHTSTQSGIFFKKSKSGQVVRVKRLQFSLSRVLRYSLQSFPNVIRVVYTVCSIFPEECDQVVDDALREVGKSFTLVNCKEKLWNEWINADLTGYDCSSKCLYTVPAVDFCQGHFIAVFERNFDVPVPPYVQRFSRKKRNQPQGEPSADLDVDFEDDGDDYETKMSRDSDVDYSEDVQI